MKYRKLGSTGMKVSQIGFGAWAIGGSLWGGTRDNRSADALDRAFELGVNFYDTALVYGNGHSERLIGKFLKKYPASIYVASKIPPKNFEWPARADCPIHDAFPPKHIVKSVEASLKHLGVETIDLMQFHVWTPAWNEDESWRRAAEKLKADGKVAHFGVSLNDCAPDDGLGLCGDPLIECLQVIYNIFHQYPDQTLFRKAAETDTGIIVRCPYDEGSLTGRWTKKKKFIKGDWRGNYFAGERLALTVDRVELLKRDLAEHGDTLPQAALQFCLADAAVSTVIPGIRTADQADDAASIDGDLDHDMLNTLRAHAWERNFYQFG